MKKKVKRIVSFLVLAVSFTFFAMPLFADEYNPKDWILRVTVEGNGGLTVVPGQTVKYTARIYTKDGSTIPRWGIAFEDYTGDTEKGGKLIRYSEVENGVAVCEKQFSKADIGEHIIIASVRWDYKEGGEVGSVSTGGVCRQTVASKLPSTLNLTSDITPSFVGQKAVFTAEVKASNNLAVSDGKVNFAILHNGIREMNESVKISEGKAQCEYTFQKEGNYKISADYTAEFLEASSSNDLNISIRKHIGDLNSDGSTDAIDFALLKKYLLGNIDDFPCENDLEQADLDGDKVITSLDYGLMHMYLLGKIDKFPVEANP